MWTLNRMARILLSQFNLIWDQLASTIVCIRISSILRQEKLKDFKICIRWVKTVEIRFVCINQAFQSSLLFHLTIFLTIGELFLAWVCVQVGIMLQSTAWKKAFLSWISPTESSDYPHVIAWRHLLSCIQCNASLSSASFCLKAF